jgi:hypothetical protein
MLVSAIGLPITVFGEETFLLGRVKIFKSSG